MFFGKRPKPLSLSLSVEPKRPLPKPKKLVVSLKEFNRIAAEYPPTTLLACQGPVYYPSCGKRDDVIGFCQLG